MGQVLTQQVCNCYDPNPTRLAIKKKIHNPSQPINS